MDLETLIDSFSDEQLESLLLLLEEDDLTLDELYSFVSDAMDDRGL
jgi:hypothetical protein